MLRRLYPGVGVREIAFSATSMLFAGVLVASTIVSTRAERVPATHVVPGATTATTRPPPPTVPPPTAAGSITPLVATVAPAADPAATVGVTSPTPTVAVPPPTPVPVARRARNRAGGLDHADDLAVCLVEGPQQLLRRPCPR